MQPPPGAQDAVHLINSHYYAAFNLHKNAAGQDVVQMRNPWGQPGKSGNGDFTLSLAAFKKVFWGYQFTTPPAHAIKPNEVQTEKGEPIKANIA